MSQSLVVVTVGQVDPESWVAEITSSPRGQYLIARGPTKTETLGRLAKRYPFLFKIEPGAVHTRSSAELGQDILATPNAYGVSVHEQRLSVSQTA